MFIGHLALGLAAKRLAPPVSLGTWFLAVSLVDLLWPFFLIAGLEHVRIDPGNTAFTPLAFTHYPITHSIPGMLVWSALLAAIWYSRHRHGRAAMLIAAAVMSHWVLDWISHGPDMPILPGGPHVGLGLWNSVAATVIVEGAMFAAAILIYVRSTRPRDSIGKWSFVALVLFLVALYIGNALAPPPPDERALAYGALAGWVLIPWPYWVDRHRRSLSSSERRSRGSA